MILKQDDCFQLIVLFVTTVDKEKKVQTFMLYLCKIKNLEHLEKKTDNTSHDKSTQPPSKPELLELIDQVRQRMDISVLDKIILNYNTHHEDFL